MRLATIDRQALFDNVLLGFGAVGNDIPGISYPSYNDELPQTGTSGTSTGTLRSSPSRLKMKSPSPSTGPWAAASSPSWRF